MVTVVNNPGGGNGDSSGMGVVLGVLIAIVVIGLFVVYGWPAIRGEQAAPTEGTTNVNVTLPSTGTSGTPGY